MTQDVFPPLRAPGFMERVIFTSSGTFTKGNYPGAQSVIVTCVGGGGGGGANDFAGSGGGGGGAGGTASQSHLSLPELSTSETVTVGSGGTKGDSSNNYTGQDGGTTSFGSLVVASGGGGGDGSNVGTNADARGGANTLGGSSGDLIAQGTSGQNGSNSYTADSSGAGHGGSAGLGFGGGGIGGRNTNGTYTGGTGQGYGGGGGGGFSTTASGVAGGAGSAGVVIVDVFSSYAGNTGDLLTKDYVNKAPVQEVTASTYTVAQDDTGVVKKFTANCTIDLPTGVDIGSIVELLAMNSGGLTVQAGSGATVHGAGTVGQYNACSALVVDVNTWVVSGAS